MHQNTKKLSDLRQAADEWDFLGRHMEVVWQDDETGDMYLSIRVHELPSYGYCNPEYEDTAAWYDDWWSLFVNINITKEIIKNHYSGPDCDGYKVIIDEEINYNQAED